MRKMSRKIDGTPDIKGPLSFVRKIPLLDKLVGSYESDPFLTNLLGAFFYCGMHVIFFIIYISEPISTEHLKFLVGTLAISYLFGFAFVPSMMFSLFYLWRLRDRLTPDNVDLKEFYDDPINIDKKLSFNRGIALTGIIVFIFYEVVFYIKI